MNYKAQDTTGDQRLRIIKPEVPFHIVLVNPEIPQNTGNIARLCAATGSNLHLVGKLGFSTDEKAVRRAGLDYWHLVSVTEHPDLKTCLQIIGEEKPLLFTTRASKSFVDAPYKQGSALVFGSESTGLPKDITKLYKNEQYGIPTTQETVRSLNLSNSTAIIAFKALEVIGALSHFKLE